MVRKTDNPTDPIGPPELPSKAAPKTNNTAVGISETGATDDIVIAPASIDTPESDAAIDAIVAQEADQILAAQDTDIAAAANAEPTDSDEKHGHPVFWFVITFLVVLALIFAYVLTNPDLDLPFSA
jgi:hypothetical protein